MRRLYTLAWKLSCLDDDRSIPKLAHLGPGDAPPMPAAEQPLQEVGRTDAERLDLAVLRIDFVHTAEPCTFVVADRDAAELAEPHFSAPILGRNRRARPSDRPSPS